MKAATARPAILDKPLIDFARSGGFPLEGISQVTSQDMLVEGLTRGCRLRVRLPQDASIVTATGSTYPQLDLLRIDISNGNVHEHYKPRQLKAGLPIEPALEVKRFEYLAAPLHYQNRTTSVRICASDARFGLVREPSGSSMLVMTDASEGLLQFSARTDDLRPMMLMGARTHARGGFWVRDAAISVVSEHTRTLAAELNVAAVWLLVPTTFRIKGRMTVDDACNVTLSGLSCVGEDMGGKLIAGYINGKLQKLDGRTMPMARWPGDRIAIQDVRIQVDDELRMMIAFGSRVLPHVARNHLGQPNSEQTQP